MRYIVLLGLIFILSCMEDKRITEAAKDIKPSDKIAIDKFCDCAEPVLRLKRIKDSGDLMSQSDYVKWEMEFRKASSTYEICARALDSIIARIEKEEAYFGKFNLYLRLKYPDCSKLVTPL